MLWLRFFSGYLLGLGLFSGYLLWLRLGGGQSFHFLLLLRKVPRLLFYRNSFLGSRFRIFRDNRLDSLLPLYCLHLFSRCLPGTCLTSACFPGTCFPGTHFPGIRLPSVRFLCLWFRCTGIDADAHGSNVDFDGIFLLVPLHLLGSLDTAVDLACAAELLCITVEDFFIFAFKGYAYAEFFMVHIVKVAHQQQGFP